MNQQSQGDPDAMDINMILFREGESASNREIKVGGGA
jgi:hypothetical protein